MNSQENPILGKTPIFLHVPKTAGTFVNRSLRRYEIKRPRGLGHHMVNEKLKEQTAFDYWNYKAHLKNCFYFTVVRNPYDLLVSNWKHGRTNKNGPEKHTETFEEYVRYWCDKTNEPFPLYVQLWDEDNNYVPEITIRNEKVEQGLTEMMNMCKPELGFQPLPNRQNVTDSRERDWKQYYTKELRELVANHFKDELELFGYDFDGPTDDKAIITVK